MPSPARTRFYTAVPRFMWSQTTVPTPQAVAAFLEGEPFEDPPDDLAVMIGRLKRWPAGRAYPALPDDEAIKHGARAVKGWWEPGSTGPSLSPSAINKMLP